MTMVHMKRSVFYFELVLLKVYTCSDIVQNIYLEGATAGVVASIVWRSIPPTSRGGLRGGSTDVVRAPFF